MARAAIAVVGDRDPANDTHRATSDALAHAAGASGVDLGVTWVPTTEADIASVLARFDGVLVAPGSPYASMDGALAAIRWARAADVPLLATCGGFQHLVLELARHVLGVTDAQHAEVDPYASELFVTPLSCSLAGQRMDVELRTGTVARAAYGSATTTERYYCDFGLNPERLGELTGAGLVVSGVDADGEVRVVELPGLRFFVGTLFVPQTSSAPGRPHPLVAAFVARAARG